MYIGSRVGFYYFNEKSIKMEFGLLYSRKIKNKKPSNLTLYFQPPGMFREFQCCMASTFFVQDKIKLVNKYCSHLKFERAADSIEIYFSCYVVYLLLSFVLLRRMIKLEPTNRGGAKISNLWARNFNRFKLLNSKLIIYMYPINFLKLI